MSLSTYKKKRDFKKTPEPKGARVKSRAQSSFVIQKHAASHLHYDFRLELDGVLKSWAVPKGPSLDPAMKRLAVHVEDHPLEYGNFQGIIPAGEYGGGTVMVWDKGKWECLNDDPIKAYQKGHLSFILKGKKLHGEWTLVRFQKDPKNWLLIKAKDDYSKSSTRYDITKAMPLSALDDKTLDEIANKKPKQWKSNKKKVKNKPQLSPINLNAVPGIKKAPFPRSISPQLATLVNKIPAESHWLYEVKFDGYRLLGFIKENQVKLMTRGENDWTDKFPEIAASLKRLNLNNAIVDGELVAIDKDNKSNFQLLQNSISEKTSVPLYYYIFDIVYLNNFDLTNVELLERKAILKNILKNLPDNIRFSDHLVGDGNEIFAHACELKLEGIMAKDAHGKYLQKRSKSWLKIKCQQAQEFVIGGFTKPEGQRKFFGSLLLGYFDASGQFLYCGNVGTGFTEATLKLIYELLQKNISAKMPYINKPRHFKNVTWVKPTLVAEVEFTEWTSDGSLRHPSFKGIRFDKAAKLVKREEPVDMPKKNKESAFRLTHPDKIMYPEQGVTKLDLANYYQSISKWMLPYVMNRPLTLVRCPNGWNHACFYQKHLSEKDSTDIDSVAIKESEGRKLYPFITDVAGLIALVQLGVLEIHTWECTTKQIEKPDHIVFDIDPAPEIAWKEVVDTAKLIKAALTKLKLTSFVKTTGGKGLHVVVPIQPIYDWATVKEFAHSFVNDLVTKYPDRYVATISKSKRVGKIFIDYLRNQRGATAVAPYSTRARKNATVATPLTWTELTSKLDPQQFTVRTFHKRLKKLKKDPWLGFNNVKQKLPLK